MRSRRGVVRLTALLGAMLLVAAACGDSGGGSLDPDNPVSVKLQLQWFTQSQFAGYYAAVDQGFYAEEGLDVTILQGGVDIVPPQVLAAGGAEFAVSWVPRGLVPREQGTDIVNIAQVFQRSGTLEVSWADSGITSPEDWEGKKVGNWGFGNEFELLAAIRQAGLDPATDVELIQQPFDMSLLLNREVDAAEAMIYNEYAQVLEATNPETGELYQPEDLNVIDFNEVGTAMLQDAIWADESWLADGDNEDIAVAFLKASFRGWIWCRDNFDACVDVVLDNAPTLGTSHQTWQLNEINGLIWPSPDGIGVMDKDLWDQTVEVATSQQILESAPDSGAYRTDLAEQAVRALEDDDLDINGAGWQRVEVTLNPNGD